MLAQHDVLAPPEYVGQLLRALLYTLRDNTKTPGDIRHASQMLDSAIRAMSRGNPGLEDQLWEGVGRTMASLG